MEKLDQMNCEQLNQNSIALSEDQIRQYINRIPQWERLTVDGLPQLKHSFKFKDFSEALTFTNKIGKIANEQDHHPVIVTEWGKVTVAWWTHKVKGLHLNDFIMAAKTDRLYEG